MPPDDFAELVEATHPIIRAYIASIGIPRTDVDDLAQEVYIAYYLQPESRPPEVEVLRWLKGIAKNLARNHLRRSRRANRVGLGLVAEALAGRPDDDGPAEDLLPALRRCLDRLPDRARQLVRWYYADDESAESIGNRLGTTAANVRLTMLRVRQALRSCLQRAPGGRA